MITVEEIKSAIGKVKALFPELQTLYQSIPETYCSCDEPGVCCAFLPEMTWLEALQWTRFIRDMPITEKTVMLRKFVEFYLTTPMRHSGCPFLMDGNCGIYVSFVAERHSSHHGMIVWAPDFAKLGFSSMTADQQIEFTHFSYHV